MRACPMFDGLHKKILQCNAIPADKQGTLRRERFDECCRPRVGKWCASAFHFDAVKSRAACTTKSTS